VTGYLQQIGQRIVKHLPPTNLNFRFFLVDLPEANAFVLPGGRIYVGRKLIAFTQSEDELAGIISHEIGHLIARQQTVAMTRRMKDVLSVTQVGDRKDIFEKYNQLMENAARKPNAFRQSDNHEGKDQIEADQIGLFALTAAGYDPQAHARFFDRFAETKGRTGGFFSDLFGVTRQESKRLREMIKGVAALPPGCVETRAAAQNEAYQRWQSAVVSYTGLGRKESLHAVLSKTVLEPPLRGEITHLRFSPDGKYVLAQDDSGINVLTVEPFSALFRIDALEANQAQFTPDSQNIVFHTPDLRVEIWSIADEKLKEAHEVVLRKTCFQSLLSPDGRTLACMDENFALNLFDVQSKTQIFQKKDFYTPDPFFLLLQSLINILNADEISDQKFNLINMGFSHDGKYFAAGQRGIAITAVGISTENAALAFDLQARAPLSLKGNIKKLIAGGFAFTAPDRLIAYNQEKPDKSALVHLPGGEILEEFPMFPGRLDSVTKGNYLLVRPFQKSAVGVVDVAKRMAIKGNQTSAFDMYDQVFVAERLSGELGLYATEKNQLLKVVNLPRNPLGRLRATAVSPDFKWLAVSERSRGGVWDLNKGQQAFLIRGFRGSFFSNDGLLYADMPKFADQERQLAVLDPVKKTGVQGPAIKETRALQYGQYFLVTRPAKKDGGYLENVILEMRDTQTNTMLWSKQFGKELPRYWVSSQEGTMVMSWPLASKTAEAEIKNDPVLKEQMAAMKEKEGDYFLQVLDARTGTLKGKLLIETGKGSFRISDVFAAGDWVVIADTQNRMLVYSLANGTQLGRTFGSRAAVGKATGLMCVENERGQLAVYNLASMQKRDQFSFTHPVSLVSFSQDGKRLFVLTANQTAYVLDVAGAAK
jgi:WD40 repeat protein